MGSTILITGANGFIGSHFIQLMESLCNRVVPLDGCHACEVRDRVGTQN